MDDLNEISLQQLVDIGDSNSSIGGLIQRALVSSELGPVDFASMHDSRVGSSDNNTNNGPSLEALGSCIESKTQQRNKRNKQSINGNIDARLKLPKKFRRALSEHPESEERFPGRIRFHNEYGVNVTYGTGVKERARLEFAKRRATLRKECIMGMTLNLFFNDMIWRWTGTYDCQRCNCKFPRQHDAKRHRNTHQWLSPKGAAESDENRIEPRSKRFETGTTYELLKVDMPRSVDSFYTSFPSTHPAQTFTIRTESPSHTYSTMEIRDTAENMYCSMCMFHNIFSIVF